MITQYEVPDMLREEIPMLTSKPYPGRLSQEVYTCLSDFADYTRHTLEEHDFNQAKKCFALAERIYRYGDRMVKLLIENNFINSIAPFTTAHPAENIVMRSIIPDILYSLFVKQVIHKSLL